MLIPHFTHKNLAPDQFLDVPKLAEHLQHFSYIDRLLKQILPV